LYAITSTRKHNGLISAFTLLTQEFDTGELAQRSTMCFFQGEVTPEKFKHLVEKGTEGVVVHQELWFREDEKIFLELLKQYLDLLPSDENVFNNTF